MGTKSNPAPNDCYEKALPDEPMFTLLARDPDAPRVVSFWAGLRAERKGSRDEKVLEAAACIDAMRAWKKSNPDT